jgi:hypothetical protein
LLAERLGELVEGHIRERRIVRRRQLAGRPERAADIARAAVLRLVAVGDLARQPRGGAIDIGGAVGQAPLIQPQPCRLEGIGLQHVAASIHERGVNLFDQVGPRDHQVVAVAFGSRSAEILGGEIERVDARAHRAVEDQDALLEGFEVGWFAVVRGHRLIPHRG